MVMVMKLMMVKKKEEMEEYPDFQIVMGLMVIEKE